MFHDAPKQIDSFCLVISAKCICYSYSQIYNYIVKSQAFRKVQTLQKFFDDFRADAAFQRYKR
jgi:hypothetical protein